MQISPAHSNLVVPSNLIVQQMHIQLSTSTDFTAINYSLVATTPAFIIFNFKEALHIPVLPSTALGLEKRPHCISLSRVRPLQVVFIECMFIFWLLAVWLSSEIQGVLEGFKTTRKNWDETRVRCARFPAFLRINARWTLRVSLALDIIILLCCRSHSATILTPRHSVLILRLELLLEPLDLNFVINRFRFIIIFIRLVRAS